MFHYRLDPALIRPGRVDMKERIDYATDYQLQQMFLRFYPEESTDRARIFSELARSVNDKISLAQVQGLFLQYKSNAQTVIDNVEELKLL